LGVYLKLREWLLKLIVRQRKEIIKKKKKILTSDKKLCAKSKGYAHYLKIVRLPNYAN